MSYNLKRYQLAWTRLKNYKGLSHFVLINFHQEGEKNILFQMVSVIDIQVNLLIEESELINKSIWQKGWNNNSEFTDIKSEYCKFFKENNHLESIPKIESSEDSGFNLETPSKDLREWNQ
tara:strand:- start:4274 stop:4633 length:360 start_codon:yes stop_codon:yes gene_type:complete